MKTRIYININDACIETLAFKYFVYGAVITIRFYYCLIPHRPKNMFALVCHPDFMGIFGSSTHLFKFRSLSIILEFWYVSILSSMSCQKFAVYLAISELLDLCSNLWCNNTKENFLLEICFCDFDFSFVLTKNECFFCAPCGSVATLF